MSECVHRCACPKCLREKKAYRIEYERGVRRTVPAEEARLHLAALSERGVGRRTVATLTGLSTRTLWRLKVGRTQVLRVDTARRILDVTADDAVLVPNRKNVDATATDLRIKALVALGYSRQWIAGELGVRGLIMFERVSRKRALAILDICQKVGDTPGPSHLARKEGERNHYRRPIDFGDEFYDPDWDGADDVASTQSRNELILEDYRFIRATGVNHTEAAERLGVGREYLRALTKEERVA